MALSKEQLAALMQKMQTKVAPAPLPSEGVSLPSEAPSQVQLPSQTTSSASQLAGSSSPLLAALKEKLAAQASAKIEKHLPLTAQGATPLQAGTAAQMVAEAWKEVEKKEAALNTISYNEEQRKFVELAGEGGSAVLIGPAGTGKTTCMRAVVQKLIQNEIAGVIGETDHKILKDRKGAPGIVICSFTRRAVANIRKNLPTELQRNCMTLHMLLEYEPVEESVIDADGSPRTRRVFQPTRTSFNPLPSSIRTIIVEESSMVGGSPFSEDDYLLFNQLVAALEHKVQFIFLGDIQQLPPVFGPAILGFKMLELPTVELVQVYRQALESPIIRLAHRILSGKPIPASEFPTMQEPGKLTFQPWKKALEAEDAATAVGKMLCKAYDDGEYDPDADAVLVPYNKACGSLELNRHIATHIARKEEKLVYEIVAGFNTVYLAVGDRVLVDREEAVITKIVPNKSYFGKPYAEASKTMNYWGYDPHKTAHKSEVDIDDLLDSLGSEDERKRAASHTVYYKRPDSDYEFSMSGAGDVNNILHSYAITVHKSQGSEWRKVYLIMHKSHNTMLQRELLYTAVTRAKEHLHVVCESDTFIKGILNQKIPGATWQEKAEYFKGVRPGGQQLPNLKLKKR